MPHLWEKKEKKWVNPIISRHGRRSGKSFFCFVLKTRKTWSLRGPLVCIMEAIYCRRGRKTNETLAAIYAGLRGSFRTGDTFAGFGVMCSFCKKLRSLMKTMPKIAAREKILAEKMAAYRKIRYGIK